MALVCPECGNDAFEQVRTTRTSFVLRVNDWGAEEIESVLEDGGEAEDIKCTNCFSHFPFDTDELISKEDWKSRVEYEELLAEIEDNDDLYALEEE